MIQSNSSHLKKYSISDTDINVNLNENSYIFKKFINAAIHVEKTISKKGSSTSNGQINRMENVKIMRTKRCSCSIDPGNCICHLHLRKSSSRETVNNTNERKVIEKRNQHRSMVVANSSVNRLNVKYRSFENVLDKVSLPEKIINNFQPSKEDEERETAEQKNTHNESKESSFINNQNESELNFKSDNNSSSSSLSSSSSSQVTVRNSKIISKINNRRKSLPGLSSFIDMEQNEIVKEWLLKKETERSLKQLALAQEKKAKEIEKRKIIEKEKENFKQWLNAKKKIELNKRAELDKQRRLNKLKVLEKEKKEIENQLNFKMWLKRKEEEGFEIKKRKELKSIQEKIDHNKRLLENKKAFQDWLESSKSKPKPFTFKKDFKTSNSVTYINPIPWMPNIDQRPPSE